MIMKSLKVKLKYIVSATNLIEDYPEIGKYLHQTAANYWVFEEGIEEKIRYYFEKFNIQYEIEDVETY